MINFRSQDVDGYGDRADIALAHDRAEGQMRESHAQELADIDRAVLAAQEFGSSSNARPIQDIVQEMLENEVYSRLLQKSEIVWPDELTLSEAVTDACILLGLSDEEFTPNWQDKGSQVDIRLLG